MAETHFEFEVWCPDEEAIMTKLNIISDAVFATINAGDTDEAYKKNWRRVLDESGIDEDHAAWLWDQLIDMVRAYKRRTTRVMNRLEIRRSAKQLWEG